MKNTRSHYQFLGIVVTLSVILTTPTFAMHHEKNEGSDHMRQEVSAQDEWSTWYRDLGLSQEQLEKVESLHASKEKNKRELMSTIKEKKKMLYDALEASEVDRAYTDDLVRALSAHYNQKLQNHVQASLAIRKVLTPEQFVAFQVKKKEQQMS